MALFGLLFNKSKCANIFSLTFPLSVILSLAFSKFPTNAYKSASIAEDPEWDLLDSIKVGSLDTKSDPVSYFTESFSIMSLRVI